MATPIAEGSLEVFRWGHVRVLKRQNWSGFDLVHRQGTRFEPVDERDSEEEAIDLAKDDEKVAKLVKQRAQERAASAAAKAIANNESLHSTGPLKGSASGSPATLRHTLASGDDDEEEALLPLEGDHSYSRGSNVSDVARSLDSLALQDKEEEEDATMEEAVKEDDPAVDPPAPYSHEYMALMWKKANALPAGEDKERRLEILKGLGPGLGPSKDQLQEMISWLLVSAPAYAQGTVKVVTSDDGESDDQSSGGGSSSSEEGEVADGGGID